MLDAGCGKGPVTFISMNKFKTIYSFDFSFKEVQVAISNIKSKSSNHVRKVADKEILNLKSRDNIFCLNNIIFKKFDLQEVPLKSETVDFAVCTEVIEHIPKEIKALRQLNRVLKSDGLLLISMPNRCSYYWQLMKIMTSISKNNFFRKLFKKEKLNAEQKK